MDEVFKAAKHGMYDGSNQAVHVLLLTHCLPGTIRDHRGRSLLHYMANATFLDGRPAWEAEEINNFFKQHKYYINAVDHRGKYIFLSFFYGTGIRIFFFFLAHPCSDLSRSVSVYFQKKEKVDT